jgi:hypothetical protein
MKNSSNQNEVRTETYLQPDLNELVRVANQKPSGVIFHVRDLTDFGLWRTWYLYWYEHNISVVLQYCSIAVWQKFLPSSRTKSQIYRV